MSKQNPALTRNEQVNEIIRCGRNPIHFMRTYAKIQHPMRGLIPFETYPYQDDCVKSFVDHRFNIVLKSRQLGLSTIAAAYVTWYALFKKNKNVLIIATKLSTAMNFIKKVKVILDSMPKWLMLTSFDVTKQQITFANGSVITAVPTSPDAGRSEALSLLVCDECAHIREFDDIWAGLYPTISTGGSAIIISTPNGVGGTYYKLWTDATAQTSEFNPIYLPWWVHPEHDQAWFDKETKNLPKKLVAQEFLCDFISSGDTFLQPPELEYLRALIEPPSVIEGPANGVWIWCKPKKDKRYVISSDVARGDANDFSTFHIIDAETCEIVAEYRGKIPPDKLAELLMEYGKTYNTALICPEKNTFGYFTCVKLRDAGYRRLYYKNCPGDMFEYISNTPEAVPGFDTQMNTKQQILAKLEELVRNRVIKSYSQRLYDELQAFVWNGSKAVAHKDSHDDLIMSVAIGTWLTHGGSVASDINAAEMTKAMLKASCVGRRDTGHLSGDIDSVRPVASRTMQLMNYGINPHNVSQPTDPSKVRHVDVTDFSWLLK